jgi:aspartyl-tRNA(Asn)/glutamyl-tRNA(Gln) amidotransferase subunit A
MLGVAELARSLHDREITSEQITREYLTAIEQQNPALNAYLTVMHDSAMQQASAADQRIQQGRAQSPLDGVPLALKDNIDVAGVAVTNGVGALRSRIASSDAEVTRRLRDAGAVILGKLNMDEAALGATTNNPHFGRCDNPCVPGDTPGGSSGGSGAAVAAGLCAAALGSDTLGSVRIPAAYCGVTGFLPGRGQVSRRGLSHLCCSLDQVGVQAHSSTDAAIVYDVIRGHDYRDDQSLLAADQPQPALDLSQASIATIDCGPFCDADVGAEITANLLHVQTYLASRNYAVADPLPTPTAFTDLRRASLLVIEAEGSVACKDWLELEGVSRSLRKFLNYGGQLPAHKIELARAAMRDARIAWQSLLQGYDFLLLPSAPQHSFPHDAAVPDNQADFTTPASVAGLPAISVPTGRTSCGRFQSVQLVCRNGGEPALLAMAAQIEEEFGID